MIAFDLWHRSCVIWGYVWQKVAFSLSLACFSRKKKPQRLTPFILGLTWEDHLLQETLRHKLADPLVAARRKRITGGESVMMGVGVGVEYPQLMSCPGCIQEPKDPASRGRTPPIFALMFTSTLLNHSTWVPRLSIVSAKRPADQISGSFVSCLVWRLFSLNSNYNSTPP